MLFIVFFCYVLDWDEYVWCS